MKKLDENGFSHVIVAALLVLVIGGVSVTAWRVYSAHHSNNKTNAASSQTSTKTDTNMNAQAIVAAAKQALATKFVIDSSGQNIIGQPGHIQIDSYNLAPFWQPTGYDFAVSPENGSNIYVNFYSGNTNPNLTSADARLINSLLGQQLASAGMKIVKNPALQGDIGSLPTYKNASSLCTLIPLGTDPLGITCADLSTYTAAAPLIKPFADAYYAKHPEDKNKTGFGMPKITDSKTPGYRTATVLMADSQGLFYEKNGTWVFWARGQMEPSCADFQQNPDVRLAFLGADCTDTNGNSTVQ